MGKSGKSFRRLAVCCTVNLIGISRTPVHAIGTEDFGIATSADLPGRNRE